jgi:hypothetical protein
MGSWGRRMRLWYILPGHHDPLPLLGMVWFVPFLWKRVAVWSADDNRYFIHVSNI